MEDKEQAGVGTHSDIYRDGDVLTHTRTHIHAPKSHKSLANLCGCHKYSMDVPHTQTHTDIPSHCACSRAVRFRRRIKLALPSAPPAMDLCFITARLSQSVDYDSQKPLIKRRASRRLLPTFLSSSFIISIYLRMVKLKDKSPSTPPAPPDIAPDRPPLCLSLSLHTATPT